jgi:hypothetical protein
MSSDFSIEENPAWAVGCIVLSCGVKWCNIAGFKKLWAEKQYLWRCDA